MNKKRIIKSYEKLNQKLKNLLEERYPNGFVGHTLRLTNSDKEPYFGVPLETEDTYYIVKVNLNNPKDKKVEEHDEFSPTHGYHTHEEEIGTIGNEYLEEIDIPMEGGEKEYYSNDQDKSDIDDDGTSYRKFKPFYDPIE